MSKQKYTAEFKAQVVALCNTGDRSCAQVARDLDLKYQTLMLWVNCQERRLFPISDR